MWMLLLCLMCVEVTLGSNMTSNVTCDTNPTNIDNIDDRSTACAYKGYGETCKFFCRSGFKPSGVVICGANGAWSNDQSCEDVWTSEEFFGTIGVGILLVFVCILSVCVPVMCARRGYPKKNPWLEGTKADINSEVEMKRLHHVSRYKHEISTDPESHKTFHHKDPLDLEIPLHVITHTISKEKLRAQNASNFITDDISTTDSMMESKVRLMSETEKLEKKRELMRREGNEKIETLKNLEKFLSDHVDKKMKEYSSKEKSSSSDTTSKQEWRIPVDTLYDFVHESVVDEKGLFRDEEEGNTILDRHGNSLHYTMDQQKEQLRTNFEGKHANAWDHLCCRTVNRFSTFYQRFFWHCSMWICLDFFAILGAILLVIHIWQKYDTLPSKLVEDAFSGSLNFDF